MKKHVLSAILIVTVSVALMLAVQSCKPSAPPATELTYSVFFPPTHGQAKAAEAWAKEIEKRSQGKVKIKVLAGGTLTPADQCYDGVAKGISDIGMSCFAYTRGRFPLTEVLDLPLGYPNGRVATRVANDFYKAFKPKELDDVKVLYLHAHGPGLLHTVKPVKSLADLKGMKIRSTGLSAKVITALGGTPVAMPQGDTYEAIQRGVVGGTIGPMEVLKGWKQAEVIKNTTECDRVGYTTAMFVVMNPKKWNALSPDIQKIFEDVSSEWIDVHGKTWDDLDQEGRKFSLSLGNKIIPLTKDQKNRWRAAVRPLIGDYVKAMDDKGLPGKPAVQETEKLIKKYAEMYK